MTQLTIPSLSIGALFGLTQLGEQDDLDRISCVQPKEGEPSLYLFTCADLLPAGQRLALDERGVVGCYSQGILLKKTQVESRAIALLAALALSFPFPVDQSQIHTLYVALHETQPEVCNPEYITSAIANLILTCNEKLTSLGIAIVQHDTAYQLGRWPSDK